MSLCYNRCLLPDKETSEVDLRRQSLQDNRKDFSGVQGCKNLKIFVRLMNFHKSKVYNEIPGWTSYIKSKNP